MAFIPFNHRFVYKLRPTFALISQFNRQSVARDLNVRNGSEAWPNTRYRCQYHCMLISNRYRYLPENGHKTWTGVGTSMFQVQIVRPTISEPAF